jgi:hypothetical protein
MYLAETNIAYQQIEDIVPGTDNITITPESSRWSVTNPVTAIYRALTVPNRNREPGTMPEESNPSYASLIGSNVVEVFGELCGHYCPRKLHQLR